MNLGRIAFWMSLVPWSMIATFFPFWNGLPIDPDGEIFDVLISIVPIGALLLAIFALTREAPKKYAITALVLSLPFAVSGCITLAGLVAEMGKASISGDEHLTTMANDVNALCPTVVDDVTIVDGVTSGPGRKFTINCTILRPLEDELDRNAALVRAKSQLKSGNRIFAGCKEILDHGVTITFRYRISRGRTMVVPISREDNVY